MYKVDVLLILRGFPEPSSNNIQFNDFVRYVKYVPHCGLSTARNHAIEEILLGHIDIDSYDYIGFLDDDCKVTDRTVANLSKYCNEEVLIGSYGPHFTLLSERFKVDFLTTENLTKTLNRVASCSLYFKPTVMRTLKYFYPQIGIPNKDYAVGEDTEYFLRAVSLGFKYHIDPSIFIAHPYKDSERAKTVRTDILLTFAYLELDGSLFVKLIKLILKMFFLRCKGKLTNFDIFKIYRDSRDLVKFARQPSIT
jgi:GT2 family glycosyltransferase